VPNDLTPVREYARQKGRLFRLWVEAEGIGSASKLRKKHPDWVLTRNGKPIAGGRQIDASNPDVTAWTESEIACIIKKYDLELFRIDYNATAEEGGNHFGDGFVENTLWRHVDALYAMFDRLHKQFPNVIIQNCAEGGGRLDLGIMQQFQDTELSDWMCIPSSVMIINGMTWILRHEILLRTFGTEVGAITSDGDMTTQLRQAMMVLPIFRGLSPTLEEFSPHLRYEVRHCVDLYKQVTRLALKDCRVYHQTPLAPMMERSPWMVLGYAAPDARQSLGWLYCTSEQRDSVFQFVPRGVDHSTNYEVTFLNTGRTVEISYIASCETESRCDSKEI